MRDDVCRTDHAIQVRMLIQKLHHACIAALRAEIRDLSGCVVRVESCVPQRLLHALPSGKTGRFVLFIDADVRNLLPALFQKQLCQFSDGVKVVMIDAGEAVDALSCDHERHRTCGQRRFLVIAQGRSHQNDPGNAIALHHVQILQFPVFARIRIAQDCQISFFQQLFRNAVHHLIDGFREDPGHNDPDLPHLAGAHRLGHQIGAVPGLLDGPCDPFFLFLAQRSSIQISADSCCRYARELSNFLNCHLIPRSEAVR